MASQKNFAIKNGLTVAGTEIISASGNISGSHFGTFSGTSTTRSAGTNNTQLATTAFVTGAISDLVDSSPATLNTLNELAAALGDDAAFSTTITNLIATKLPLAGGTMTGALVVTADANPSLEVSRGSANTTNVNLKYNTTLTGQLSAANEKFQISAAGSGTEMEFYTAGAKALEIDTSQNAIFTGTLTAPTLIAGAYGASGSAGDGFRINTTDIYGQTNSTDKIHLSAVSGNATFGGSISATSDGTPASSAHAAAIVTSGNYGGGFATRDTTESGWYQQNNGADWHFYHNRNVSSETPQSKQVLSFNSTGDAAFQGSVNILDGSTDFTISGDSNSNTYFMSNGEFRIRPLGTTTNKLVIGSNGSITSSSYGVFGATGIDPDSFTSYAGGFGNISDGSGWGARGLFVHGGGTGDAAAIGHNGGSLYFGIQNGSSANSMSTYMVVTPAKAISMTDAASVALPNTTAGHLDCNGSGIRMSANVQNMFHIGAENHASQINRYGNTSTRTYVDGGSSGYQGYVWSSENWLPAVFIPYSPNQVYRISASIYQLTGSTATSGASSRHYLGLAGYDENFNFLNVDNIGTYQYILASNATVSTGNFLEVDITLKGWNSSGQSNGNKMDQGTVYIRPLWLANYQSGGGTAVLTGFTIMPAGTVADNDSNAGTNY